MEIHTHNIYYPLPDQYFIMKNLLIKNMVKKNHQRQTSIKKNNKLYPVSVLLPCNRECATGSREGVSFEDAGRVGAC